MLKRSLIQILAKMIRPPPPIPWTTLPPISICMLMDSAAMRDPKKKMRLASRMIGLRPHMSLNFPQVGVDAAAASRYADPIHV